jgi:hypothetical protein
MLFRHRPLVSNLVGRLGFSFDISFTGCLNSCWGFSFIKPEWKKFKVDFEFEGANLRNLFYGFCGTDISKELDTYLRGLDYGSAEIWPLYRYMDKYRHWDQEFYIDLFSNSDNIVNIFESKIKEISSLVENKGYEL